MRTHSGVAGGRISQAAMSSVDYTRWQVCVHGFLHADALVLEHGGK